MKTIYVTEKSDTNTATWYITDCQDLIDQTELDTYPGEAVVKVISHGMYPGSHDEWRRWVLEAAQEQL